MWKAWMLWTSQSSSGKLPNISIYKWPYILIMHRRTNGLLFYLRRLQQWWQMKGHANRADSKFTENTKTVHVLTFLQNMKFKNCISEIKIHGYLLNIYECSLVNYPKRSYIVYSPLSNYILQIKWCLLIWKCRSLSQWK